MAHKKFSLDEIPKYAARVLIAARDYAKAVAGFKAFRKAHPWRESPTRDAQYEQLLKEMRLKEWTLQREAKKYRF